MVKIHYVQKKIKRVLSQSCSPGTLLPSLEWPAPSRDIFYNASKCGASILHGALWKQGRQVTCDRSRLNSTMAGWTLRLCHEGPLSWGGKAAWSPAALNMGFFVSRLCYRQPLVLSRPLRPIFWDEPSASGGKALTQGSGHGHGVLALWPPHQGAWPVHLTSPGFRSLGWTIRTLIRRSLWSFPAEQWITNRLWA